MKNCVRCGEKLPRFNLIPRDVCDECAKWRREHPELVRACFNCAHFNKYDLTKWSMFSVEVPRSQCLKLKIMLPLFGIENCKDWLLTLAPISPFELRKT